MSRRKQAKPKSTKRADENQFECEENEFDGEPELNRLTGDQESENGGIDNFLGFTIPLGTDDGQQKQNDGDGDDEEEEGLSEGSASGTPPTPNDGVTRHECTFCDSSFGSLFLLKQHEQETHSHLMPFKCKFCSKGFKHKRSHDRHEKSHSGIRKHKCVCCGQAFFRSDHLKLHMKTHETSKYPFVCILCQRGFHSSSALESHMQLHEKQKRPNVDEDQANSTMDQSEDNSETIKNNEHDNGSIKFSSSLPHIGQSQCSVCMATFKTPESLLRHMDNDHRIMKSRIDSASSNKINASSPFTPIPPSRSSMLNCHYCHMGEFYSEEALELHIQAVHGINGLSVRKWSSTPSTFNCGLCGQAFLEIGLLQKHTLHSHTLKDLDNDPNSRTASKPNRLGSTSDQSDPTYDCQTCGRAFDSILALHGHASSVHGGLPEHVSTPGEQRKSPESTRNSGDAELNNASSGDQVYQCGQCDGQCDVVFKDLAAFSAHMSQHIRSGQGSNTVQDQQLQWSNTVQDQQFQCDVCGLHLSSESSRDDHLIKHYLQKESQYCCKSCGKSFGIPDELQKHLLDMHAIHLYRCSLCKELFESRVDIQVHFAVAHSDEVLQYRCRSCKTIFTSEDQFNAHVRAVHMNSGRCGSSDGRSHPRSANEKAETDVFQFPNHTTPTFYCPFCGDAFAVEYLYEKHLENAHRSQMGIGFMVNEFVPKTFAAQLFAHANQFRGHVINGDGGHVRNDFGPIATSSSSSTVKCNICDRKCESMLELAEHKLQHCKVIHSQVCTFCHELVNSIAEFHAHIRQHNQGNGIPMACIICKQSLVSNIDTQAHAKFHLLLTSSSSSNLRDGNCGTEICESCGMEISPVTRGCTNCQYRGIAKLKRYEASAGGRRESASGNGIQELLERACESSGKQYQDSVGKQYQERAGKQYQDSVGKEYTYQESSGEEGQGLPGKERAASPGKGRLESQMRRPELQTGMPRSPELTNKCGQCNVKFETTEERCLHECSSRRRPSTTTPKPYQCIKCQKSFATELEIQAHVTTHVLQDGIHHYCMLCKKVFDSPSKLQCHLIEHSFVGCSEMQCYLCNAIFALPQSLQQHMLTKHGVDERPYDCPYPQCEQKFFFRAELENHSLLHQFQHIPNSSIPEDTMDPALSDGRMVPGMLDRRVDVETMICYQCGIPFTNNESYQAHVAVCTSGEWKRTSRASALHTTPNGEENSVPSAKKLRRSSTTKVENDGGKEENGGIHHCPHCGKSFHSLSALQGHSHVHMISKTHQCTKCRKVFPSAAKLRNHQRQHSGDKPFPCTMCMRFFSRKDNLKVHMRIHYKQGSPGGSIPSPGMSISTSPGNSFPTMVPRSSNFFTPCSSMNENDQLDAMNGQSADCQMQYNNVIDEDHDRVVSVPASVDGESCHASED